MLTLDEMNALITSAADPDVAPDALTSLAQGVGELYDHIAAQEEARKNDADTMEKLRAVNTKLFLQTTGGTPFEKAGDEEQDDYDTISAKIKEQKGW